MGLRRSSGDDRGTLLGRHRAQTFATGLDTRSTYRGRDGILQWFKEWFEPFREYYIEPLDFIDAGDSVVIASGARVELEITWVIQFGGKQFVRLTTDNTPEEALEAAGLSE